MPLARKGSRDRLAESPNPGGIDRVLGLAIDLGPCPNDRAACSVDVARDIVGRDSTSHQHRSCRQSFADAHEIGWVGCASGHRTSEDQGIGEPALDRFLGGVLQSERCQRYGVLDEDIGPDLCLALEQRTVAECFVSAAFDDTLIGHHRADMHVDANEGSTGCRRDTECCTGIVAQDVDPNRQSGRHADRLDDDCHERDDMRLDTVFPEWSISEVLDDEGVGTPFPVGFGVAASTLADPCHVPRRTGGAR